MNSIQTSLAAFLAASFLLIVVVSVSAVIGLKSIDNRLSNVSRRWVAGNQVLEELGSKFAEFRISEGYRALASSPAAVRQADFLAGDAAKKAATLFKKYEALIGERDPALDHLRELWSDTLSKHQAWTALPGAQARGVGYGSELQKGYEAVQLASRQLIGEAKRAATREAEAGSDLADRITAVVTGLSALACLVMAASLGRVIFHVVRPLRSITGALSRLASGERDIAVPNAQRADEIGEMVRAFHIFVANATALAEAQSLSERLSLHDALTGLPNRRRFAGEFEDALHSAVDGSSAYAVMLIDLDRFKPVNDLRGHAAGDAVLREVAARLTRVVPRPGRVARLGGDEFAVIVDAAGDPAACADLAARTARNIVAAVSTPIPCGGLDVTVGASVGIAVYPADGSDAETMLHAADLAMYRAKSEGRGTFRFFEPSMVAELHAEAELASDLREAIEDGAIRPHYQPLIDMNTNRICGFEVLARWHHAERGAVPPDVFIPVAERTGVLGDLTRSVLSSAVRDFRDVDEGMRLAVNVSPPQLQDPTFSTLVADILAAEGFAPSRLEIEVTETALADDLVAVSKTIAELQRQGIRVALDDFGIGVSNLHHLHQLSFDKIKIDRSFVQSMATSAESEKIVFAALDLARNLGMSVVAEGIEDADTVRRLCDRGCEYGQGYFFSRAVPIDTALSLLAAQEGGLAKHLQLAEKQMLEATAA